MPYEPGKGKTLLIPSGSRRDPGKNHLFITLTNKCPDGQHLLISICSVVPGRFHDPACEIAIGEHEFITDQSYVEYRFPLIRHGTLICKCVDGWVYRKKADLEAAIFDRVCRGVEVSEFLPKWALDYFLLWRDN